MRANYYNLNQYLHAINWNVLLEYCFSVEDCWSEFRYQIELAFKAHVPRPLHRTKPKKRHHSFTECCELNLNYGKPGSVSKTLGTGSYIIVLLKTVVTLSRNIMHPLNLICFGAETQVDSIDTSVESCNLVSTYWKLLYPPELLLVIRNKWHLQLLLLISFYNWK